jgi:prepilin-type processing-associated H-X9-DG protein
VRDGGVNWDGTPLGGDGWPLAQGANLELSYRHGCGRGAVSGRAQDNVGEINAVFFDGHVARFDDRASRNIEYWYPSGARVSTHDGMHDVSTADDYRVP